MDMKKPSNFIFFLGVVLFVLLLALSLSVPYNPEPKKAVAVTDNDNRDYSQFVTLGEYKGLPLSSKPQEVTDEEVDALYENFKASYVSYDEDSNNSADIGDLVTLDYTMGDNDTHLAVEGIVGGSDIPEQFSTAIVGLSEGESAVVDLKSSGGDIYYVTVGHIHEPIAFTDDYIKSLNLPDVQSIDDVKTQLRNHLVKEKDSAYAESAKEELIAQVYNTSTFNEIPDDYVAPFKEQLKIRLDNAVAAYSLQGEEKTYDDILADTYAKDGISTVDEYLDMYGLQNARTYAICQKIAENEHISVDMQKAYSLAATDWVNVKDSYADLVAFLSENDIGAYERASLLEDVKDYLYEASVH